MAPLGPKQPPFLKRGFAAQPSIQKAASNAENRPATSTLHSGLPHLCTIATGNRRGEATRPERCQPALRCSPPAPSFGPASTNHRTCGEDWPYLLAPTKRNTCNQDLSPFVQNNTAVMARKFNCWSPALPSQAQHTKNPRVGYLPSTSATATSGLYSRHLGMQNRKANGPASFQAAGQGRGKRD